MVRNKLLYNCAMLVTKPEKLYEYAGRMCSRKKNVLTRCMYREGNNRKNILIGCMHKYK